MRFGCVKTGFDSQQPDRVSESIFIEPRYSCSSGSYSLPLTPMAPCTETKPIGAPRASIKKDSSAGGYKLENFHDDKENYAKISSSPLLNVVSFLQL